VAADFCRGDVGTGDSGAQIAPSIWLQAEARNHVTTSKDNPEQLFPGRHVLQHPWIGPDGQLIFDSQEAAALAPKAMGVSFEEIGPVELKHRPR
jgi:hypothetical protein